MQEILLKIRYFERGLSKNLNKVNFIYLFFRTQSLLMEVWKNFFISYVLFYQFR